WRLLLSLATLLPFLLARLILIWPVRQEFIRQIQQRNQERASYVASHIESSLNEVNGVITSVTHMPLLSFTPSQREAILTTIADEYPGIQQLVLLRRNGRELANSAGPSSLPWEHNPAYRRVIQGQRCPFEPHGISATHNFAFLRAAFPLTGTGSTPAGVLIVDVNLGAVWDQVQQANPSDGQIYLMTGHGELLAYTGPYALAQKVTHFISLNIDGAKSSGRLRLEHGDSYLWAQATVPTTDWSVVTVLPPGWGIGVPLGLVRWALAGMMIALVGAWLLSDQGGKLLAALDPLLQATRRVARGHLDVEVPVASQDELGELTAAFNQMIQTLRSNMEFMSRRNRELRALDGVVRAAARSLDLDRLLEAALEELLRMMGAQSGSVHLWDQSREELVLTSHRGGTAAVIQRAQRLKLGEGLTGRVAQSRHGLVLNLDEYPSDTRDVVAAGGWHSFASVPVIHQTQLLGVVTCASTEIDAFDDRDLQTLQAIADQLAVAIANAQLFAQERARSRELEALARVGRALHEARNLRTVLQVVLEEALALTGQDVGAVLLLDPKTDSLRIMVNQGLPREAVEAFNARPVYADEGTFRRCFVSQDIVEASGAWSGSNEALDVEYILHALSVAPLALRNAVIGVIALGKLPGDESSRRLLRALGNLAAVAIERTRLYEQVQQYSRRLETMVADRTRELVQKKQEAEERNQAMLNILEDLH
ncbi:MAG TPA: GAF domain-containing protein, partial [Anaerolineae bacterium]|nr:GAF domain-containing protein [Anaerolineae bacterium]